jgi:hypothetical protein
MLGQVLNELAQVELWLSNATKGHESHNPDACLWAELLLAMAGIDDETEEEISGTVVFALLMLLRKTQNPAKAGLIIVDKVRKVCAAMARDRIATSRENRLRWSNDAARDRIDAYDTPN